MDKIVAVEKVLQVLDDQDACSDSDLCLGVPGVNFLELIVECGVAHCI